MSGGKTRLPTGQIPPLRNALTIAKAPSKNWKLTRSAAADWLALNTAWIKAGGEALRLSDAFRDARIQQDARDKYDNWINAGKPTPGSTKFHKATMKTAYVARPGQSNHGWGGAVDIGVKALFMKGTGRGTDETLGKFWDMAAKFGWRPIINHPVVDQDESWHFDHLGPLQGVYDLFRKNGRGAYGYTATVGAALTGTLPRSDKAEWIYVQSRIILAGQYIGAPDGVPGRMTKAGLKALGIDAATVKQGVHHVAAALNKAKIAEDLIAAA